MDNVVSPSVAFPERAARIRRGVARLCLLLGWSPLQEVGLPNGRRADVLALQPGGDFVAIEIKSGARDFLTDQKWPDYRAWCDAFCFAVDPDFPQRLLPPECGLIVAAPEGACVLREPPVHRLPAARRRILMLRFATLAATRLAGRDDPDGMAAVRHALRVE